MPATPKRAGRRPRPGSRFPAELLADNVRGIRSLRRLSQQDLAERMGAFGHEWHRATVSEVERGGRSVTVDELLALAFALDTDVPHLLDPSGPDGRDRRAIDVGNGDVTDAGDVRLWLEGRAELGFQWEGNTPRRMQLAADGAAADEIEQRVRARASERTREDRS